MRESSSSFYTLELISPPKESKLFSKPLDSLLLNVIWILTCGFRLSILT